MSLHPYSTYKDSGVKSLGSVPAHWDVAPIKYHVALRSGGTPSKEDPSYWDGDVPWASSKDLKTELLADTQDHITSHALEAGAAELIPAGSILIVVRGMILAHTFPVAKVVRPMAINQDLKAIIPHERLSADYLAWLLRGVARESLGRADEAAHGTKVLRLADWASMEIPLPTWSEQTAIVAFLEHETAKIDALIAEQQRLIELLQEKRQAVISHAVTKGLNPDAPMKPSGVEWLGDVPAHWTVTRLKYLLASTKAGPFGSSLTKDAYVSEGFRVYGQEQVIPNDFSIGDYYITSEKFEELSQYAVRPGDILVSCVGTFGKIAIVPAHAEPGIINPRLMRLRCSAQLDSGYLVEVLKSQVVFSQFESFSRGGTMDVINIGTLSELVIAIPPREQQLAIHHFLVRATQEVDALTREAAKAIALLESRRAALISAAVTGQIDVRDLTSAEAA